MLAAYLRRLDAAGARTSTAGAAATLRAMITVSDNNAADAIYSSLGDEPIEAAARAAGARTVDVRGYWSETYLSAEDGARFMRRVRTVVPRRFRRFAMGLLAGHHGRAALGDPGGGEEPLAHLVQGRLEDDGPRSADTPGGASPPQDTGGSRSPSSPTGCPACPRAPRRSRGSPGG